MKLRIQFDNSATFFCKNWSKISVRVQKGEKKLGTKLLIGKNYLGQLDCSSNIPVGKLDKKPENSCSLFKNHEKIHLFSKTVFSSKLFYRCQESSSDRPAKFSLLNFRKWSKKSPQKMQKLFKIIFFKKVLWRGREQLESPAQFFRQPAELFPIDFQKITVCKFSNRISPEKFPWNWESSLTTPLVFSENWSKISLTVQKGKKYINKTLLR